MSSKALLLASLMLIFLWGSAWGMHHEVKIAEKAGVGKYLTDAEGMTLYWFKKDSRGTSVCSGNCLARWPLYYRPTVAPPAVIAASDFETITRGDGQKQTGFRGYPLYYWVGDKAAGEINGQGVGGVWFVIDPDQFPVP